MAGPSTGAPPGSSPGSSADAPSMLAVLRAMPGGVRVFLVYALAILVILGLTLPLIVAQASGDIPISPIGVVWMALLAYLIFTMTLVLQRKQAAFGLSLGLVTLVVPLIPLLTIVAGVPGLVFAVALGLILLRGLLGPSSRVWFDQP